MPSENDEVEFHALKLEASKLQKQLVQEKLAYNEQNFHSVGLQQKLPSVAQVDKH